MDRGRSRAVEAFSQLVQENRQILRNTVVGSISGPAKQNHQRQYLLPATQRLEEEVLMPTIDLPKKAPDTVTPDGGTCTTGSKAHLQRYLRAHRLYGHHAKQKPDASCRQRLYILALPIEEGTYEPLAFQPLRTWKAVRARHADVRYYRKSKVRSISYLSLAESRLRPLRRRFLRILRPALVFMRARKPCCFLRFVLLGWYVCLAIAKGSVE